MNTETYLHIFYKGAGLTATDTDDTICIGTMLPIYSPSGVDKVMQYHCRIIDLLIEISPTSLATVQLLAMRGMTYHEYYNILFDLTIKEADFGKYPALRCLFLSSNKERREKVIYNLTRDRDGYEKLLAQILRFHSSLHSILFGDES